MELCPWCGREFAKIEDFFYMKILDAEIMESKDIPETLVNNYRKDFNHAPEIAKLLGENEPVKKYLNSIRDAKGKEITRSKILPNLKKDAVFKAFYKIPGNEDYYLSLEEGKVEGKKSIPGRLAEISIYGKGPNIGSAGGPTLVRIAKIGRINYDGLLNAFTF